MSRGFVKIEDVKPPCTNVKPPYWRLSGDGSAIGALQYEIAVTRQPKQSMSPVHKTTIDSAQITCFLSWNCLPHLATESNVGLFTYLKFRVARHLLGQLVKWLNKEALPVFFTKLDSAQSSLIFKVFCSAIRKYSLEVLCKSKYIIFQLKKNISSKKAY